MYVLKRIGAMLIDYALVYGLVALCLSQLPKESLVHLHLARFGLFGSVAALGSTLLSALILGISTGITGQTPGKFLLSLRVRDPQGDPPGVPYAILREFAKIIAFSLIYGIFYALATVMRNRDAFYDQWLGLEVEDLHPYGMTETQKNWRKYWREKERRERSGRR